jgi:hypothetical protein
MRRGWKAAGGTVPPREVGKFHNMLISTQVTYCSYMTKEEHSSHGQELGLCLGR